MEVMHFAGRDVKPFGEFVRAADLLQGRTYFRLSYLDQSLADLPATVWKRGACRFDTMPDGEYSTVFEFEKALDQLLACSLRRQKLLAT
jgi:hypothetical protein